MLEKQVELLGELTAKTHKAERAITQASIARALEEARAHVGKTRQEIDNRLDQIENDFRDTEHEVGLAVERQYQAMGARIDGVVLEQADQQRRLEGLISDLKAQDIAQLHKRADQIENAFSDAVYEFKETTRAEHIEELEKLQAQLKAQEDFEAALNQRLDQIQDGEKGEKGEKGDPGEPGIDRPITEPVEIKDGANYAKGTTGAYGGGLWVSRKEAVGAPDEDPHAWTCILDGIASMTVELQDDRSYCQVVRMASGREIRSDFHIPFPDHRGIWEKGAYKAGHIVTKGHSMWLAMEDTDGAPPGNGWQQILTSKQGKEGPPGKSVQGPQGVPGRNGRDANIAEVVDLVFERLKQYLEDRD